MTLVEKIDALKSLIDDLRAESALALSLQGLYTQAEDLHLKDIPDRILQIRVYDFNYKFDFKALESVGTIHSRAEGLPAGGMGIYPQAPALRTDVKLNMKQSTPITYCFSGVWGQPASIAIDCVFPTITYHKIDFKAIPATPEQFIAPPEEDE